MSNFQQKPNTGALFTNKQRKTETHPEYTGTVNVNGQEFFINAWLNTAQSTGEKYFSLKLNPKQQEQPVPAQQQYQGQPVPAQPMQSVPVPAQPNQGQAIQGGNI